jgi:hypothetical protein
VSKNLTRVLDDIFSCHEDDIFFPTNLTAENASEMAYIKGLRTYFLWYENQTICFFEKAELGDGQNLDFGFSNRPQRSVMPFYGAKSVLQMKNCTRRYNNVPS